jgi:hypothetical protein
MTLPMMNSMISLQLGELRRLVREVSRRYAYHGTSSKRVEQIKRRGLVPGGSMNYADKYSEYDDGNHLFFTDDEARARDYGDVVIKFPWPVDAKQDMNTFGRVLPHQFVSKNLVPGDQIEFISDITEISQDCWGGSNPDELYEEELADDPDMKKHSVLVPDDVKAPIAKFMKAMGLAGTKKKR